MDTSAALLATQAVAILLPFLNRAAESVVPKAAEDLYAAVKARFSGKPAAEEAIHDLEQSPEDPDTQAVVRAQLKKALAEDPTFAAELHRLVKKVEESGIQPRVSASNRGVAAGRDIRGNVITGDVGGSISTGDEDREDRQP